MSFIVRKLAFSAVAALSLSAGGALAQTAAPPPAQSGVPAPAILPPGAGRDTLMQVCSQCHSPDIVATQRHSADGWHNIIVTMIGRGAMGTDDQFDQIENYLTNAFPPDVKAMPAAPSAKE